MKTGRFFKISSALIIAAAFALAVSGDLYAFSGEDVFAGANGLVKEAVDTIRNGAVPEGDGAAFNMDIEPMVERDLSGTIMNGIYVDDINLSGKTYDEAVSLIKDKVSTMSGANITLHSIGENTVVVTAAELGLTWDDTNMVDRKSVV